MKVRAVRYADDGEPAEFDVTLSLAEAAAISAIGGKLNGYAHRRLRLGADDELHGLGGEFNRHWDDGEPYPLRFDLSTINQPMEDT